MKTRHATRTIKTVGWLLVSMTGGAGLLSMAEPTYPSVDTQGRARCTPARAVSDVQASESRDFQRVVVHYGRAETEAGGKTSLPADFPHSKAEDYHFLVQPDGNVIASRAWREQSPLGADEDGLHIGLAAGRNLSLVPRLQWNAFQELLRRLRLQCRLDAGQINWARTSDQRGPPGLLKQGASIRHWLVSGRLHH